MTTPNIEELIARLGALANTEANELADALNEAADLLQSQAKRLEELEEELAGRTDYALSLRRRLTTARMEVHTLRAQLAEIEKSEPAQGEPVDRSDAVNLARNIINESWTNEDVTTRGVRLMADAVLLMDTALQSAQPVAQY